MFFKPKEEKESNLGFFSPKNNSLTAWYYLAMTNTTPRASVTSTEELPVM